MIEYRNFIIQSIDHIRNKLLFFEYYYIRFPYYNMRASYLSTDLKKLDHQYSVDISIEELQRLFLFESVEKAMDAIDEYIVRKEFKPIDFISESDILI